MRGFLNAKWLVGGLVSFVLLYAATVNIAVPLIWGSPERPAAAAMLTRTPQGGAGDPINIGLVGVREEILKAFAAARWHPADPETTRSSLGAGIRVVFDRPYSDAPVSTLLYEGRRQDLAFERLVAESADRRHHLRLWRTEKTGADGRPLWLGAASYDRTMGNLLQFTNHAGSDMDVERDRVVTDLQKAGVVVSMSEIQGIGATENRRGSSGDIYRTDGRVVIAVLQGPNSR
jgi:hypothetical protein